MSYKKYKFIFFAAAALFLVFLSPVFSSNSAFINYPQIETLNNSDVLFRQLASDINLSYRVGRERLPISIFRYSPRRGETLFSIAARLNLPYETLSTLNRISSINDFNTEREIIIPNQPALFIPEHPNSDIEYILRSRNEQENNKNSIFVFKADGSREKFFYIPNGRFNSTERAFFLNTFFRFPIERGRITSHFGYRLSPISGQRHFHAGIDIAAPSGTPVFAAARGVVVANSYDRIFGNYIIIKHPGSYYTLYGHLRKSFVTLNSQVNSGTIIGEVGSTGYSTGPHLHFEVRRGNVTKNPLNLFRREQ
ncbi:MAG: M23 family metallopeptidase [Spirochaetes bacterium]|nr:M23 family metallopeptidase [Spirochaetota bacterium]